MTQHDEFHPEFDPVELPKRKGRKPQTVSQKNESKAKRKAYHRTYDKDRKRSRVYAKDTSHYRMIAWDGEGMKIHGAGFPQQYVLFGCSADSEHPLIATKGITLKFETIVDYALKIKKQFPEAYHVGYFFRYDQNMIIQSLGGLQKQRLYETGYVSHKNGNLRYAVKWIPGKKLHLSRRNTETDEYASILIEDIAPFFASKFTYAYADLFPEQVDSPAFRKVTAGKDNRASMLWDDMPQVLEYWTEEIALLEQLATRFRNLMYEAGFRLKSWYGPGALATYLRKAHDLAQHEYGGKEENMPDAVHAASKRAYFGGRFEQFKAGHIKGPIYYYDLNSAYPAAIAKFRSMAEGGHWQHVTKPSYGNPAVSIAVYRIRFFAKHKYGHMAMPFPHRDDSLNTTFPTSVRGWYWLPEVRQAIKLGYGKQMSILEGWEWIPANHDVRPWNFLEDIYQRRALLKKQGSPVQMAYKLAMNSMYGKFAQRVGWDKEEHTPPRAHTLPLAGWITSWCRAEIMTGVRQIPPEDLIAIETDGIITTTPPEKLNLQFGDGLGEWGYKAPWHEMFMIQSGLYLYRTDDGWAKPKTRGMDSGSIDYEFVFNYLNSLMPNETWEPASVPQSERFIALGSAISRSRITNKTGSPINTFKLEKIHCKWESNNREIIPGKHGKRVHVPQWCPACIEGQTPAVKAHTLFTRSGRAVLVESQPYTLPWEKGYEKPLAITRGEIESDEISEDRR